MDESSVTFQLSVSGPGEFGLTQLNAAIIVLTKENSEKPLKNALLLGKTRMIRICPHYHTTYF